MPLLTVVIISDFGRPYTISRAYGTMLCPSVVCRMSATYVLWLNGTSYGKLSEDAYRVARPLPGGTN